ncbi:uncharacterized protein LOC115224504 [Octopus sinensis]|uniref:Uncharacterized protein LOC115224504 n=1 Tax=Octopus sinensis TaxID=2607531 RepID=A0A6P7TI34_9MOLL|nr:uncharacterized protein LOC115224504 [Octopus sinensis]
METSQTFNFNIPKLKRQATKDNLLEIDPKSRDAKEILANVTRSYLDQNYCGPWQIQAIHSVRNTELEQDYRSKRTELKEEGRHNRELSDQIAFYAIRDPSYVPKIAKNGLTTNNLPFSIIGDHNSGVYLSKHADVSLQTVETISNQLTTALFVFNVLTGKCKPVNERLMSSIEPTPNYDCHVGLQPPQLSDIHIIQMQRSQIYLYEYDDEGMPAPRPRHCLPYAVITYERKADTITPGSLSKSIYIYDPTKGPPPSKKSDEKSDWKKGPRHPVPFKNVPNNLEPNIRMLPGIRPPLLGPGLSDRDHMLQNVFPQDTANEQCRMLASLFLGYGPQPPLPDISQKVLVQRSGSDPRMKCRQDQIPLDAEHCPPPVDNPSFSMENNGQFKPQFYTDDIKMDVSHIWGQPNPMPGYSNEPTDQMNWYPLPYSRPLLQNEVDPQCLGDQHPWKHNEEVALNMNLNQYEGNSQNKPANIEWHASGSEFFENKDWRNSYLNNCDNKISGGSGIAFTNTGTMNSIGDTSNTTTITTTTTAISNSSSSSNSGGGSNAKTRKPIPFALNKKKPAGSTTETKIGEKKSSDIELTEKSVQDLLDRLPTVKKEPSLHHTDMPKKSSVKSLLKASVSASKNLFESELFKKGSSKTSDSVTSVIFPKSSKSSSEAESSPSGHIKGQENSMHELMMQLLSSQENEPFEPSSNKKSLTSKLKSKKPEESTKKHSLNKMSIEDLKKLKDVVHSKLKASKEHKSGLTNSTQGALVRVTPKIKNTALSGKTGLKTTILLPTVADQTEETALQSEALSKLLNTVESTIEAREQPQAPASSRSEVAEVSEFEKKYKSFLHKLRKRQIKDTQSHKLLEDQEGMLCDEIPPPVLDAVGIDDVNTKLMKELLLLDPDNSESTSVSEADSLYLPPSERKKKKCSMASRSLLKKKAPFDMTGYRRRRKRQKMRRKASEFDNISLASTTSTFGDKTTSKDNNLLSEFNKYLDLDFPISDLYLEQEKSLFGEELPAKRTPTLRELGYDDWKSAMFSVRFQPVVALNDCIKQITSHLKREGTSNVMNWIGSHQDLMNALNIPEQTSNAESLSKSLSSATSQMTSKSESATNIKLSKFHSKPSPVSKVDLEEFGSTIDITSLKNDAKRKFVSKCEKANKLLKLSSGDSFKKKIKVAKDKFSSKSPPKEKKLGIDKKVSSTSTTSKPDKEKKLSTTSVPSKKPTTSTHPLSSTSSLQSKSNTSTLAKATTTTASTTTSTTTTVPKSIMKTPRAEPLTKGTGITPSTFPATDQSLKVDLLLDSIIEPPPIVVTEPKKPKSVISFEAYKEKRLKPKSPPREKMNVFDSLQDIFPAEKEPPIFDKPKPEKLLLEPPKDIEPPNLFSNLVTPNFRDPRLVGSQKEPPPLKMPLPLPKLPLPIQKAIPPLMNVNPILPLSIPPLLPVIPPLLPVNPPLPPLLMPSLQKSVPLLKGNPQLNKSTPQSPKIIPQSPKIIPSTNKPLSSVRDDPKIFPKNKPLSKKPSALPKTIPTSVTVSLKDPREQVGLVDPRLAKNLSLAVSKGPPSQPPASQDIHSSKEESIHDPSLPRDPRLLRMNRDLSSNPLTNDGNKSSKPLLLQESPADLYNPVKINSEEIEDVSAHISKDMTSSSKTVITKKPWNLCIIQTSVDKPKPIYEPKQLSVIPINKDVTPAIPKLSFEEKPHSKDNIPDYAKFSKEIIKGFKPSTSISLEKGEMYSPVSPERNEEPAKVKSVPQNEPGNDHKTWGFYREMLPRKSVSDDTNSVSEEDSKLLVSKQKPGSEGKLNSERNSSMRAFSPGHCMNADSDDSDNSNEDLTKPLYIDESASGTHSDNNDHRLSPIKEMLKSLDSYDDDDDDDDSCDATSWKLPSMHSGKASKSESDKKNLSHQQKSHEKAKNLFQSLNEDFGSVSPSEAKDEGSEKASSSDPGKLFSAYEYKGHEDSSNDTSHIWMKSLTTLSQAKAVSLNISDEMMDMLRKVVKGSKDSNSPVSPNCDTNNKGQADSNGKKSESAVESKCGVEEERGKHFTETVLKIQGGGKEDFNKTTADSNVANKKNQTVTDMHSTTHQTTDEMNSMTNAGNDGDDQIDECMSGQAIPVLRPAKKRTSVKRARSQSPTAFSSLKLFPPPNWLPTPSPFLVSSNPLKNIDWSIPPSTSHLATSLHSQQLLWSPALSMSQSLLSKSMPFPVGFPGSGLTATNPLLLNRPINPLMVPRQNDLVDWFADKINPKSQMSSVNVAQSSTSSLSSPSTSSSDPAKKAVTASSSELETLSKETDRNSKPDASNDSENANLEISELQSTKDREKEKCELSRSSCYSPTDKTLELSSLSCLDHSQSSESSKDGLAEKAENAKMKKSSSNELFLPSMIPDSFNSNAMPEIAIPAYSKASRKELSSVDSNDCDNENDAAAGTISDTSKQSTDDHTSATEGLNASQDVDLLSDNAASDDINNEVSKLLSYMGAKKRRSSKERSKSSNSSKSKQSKRSKHDDSSHPIPKSVQISTINSRKLKEASLPESNRKLLKELAKQFSKRKQHKSDLQALLESVKKIKKELASQPSESSGDLPAGKTSAMSDKERAAWAKKEQQKSGSKRSSGEKSSSRSKHHKSSEKKWAENLWKPVKTEAEEKAGRSSDAPPIVINYKQKGSEKTDVPNVARTNSGSKSKKSSKKEEEVEGKDDGDDEKNEQNCDSELEEGELLDEDDDCDMNAKESFEPLRRSESLDNYPRERWWHDKRDHPNDERFYESNPGRPPRDMPWDMENKPDGYRHACMDNYSIEQPEGFSRNCFPLKRAEPFPHNRMEDCPFPQPEGYSMNQMDNYPPEHDDSFPYNMPEDIPHNQMENYSCGRSDGNKRGKPKNYHGKRGHYPHGGKFAPFPPNKMGNCLPEDSKNYEMESDGYYNEEHKKFPRGKSENYPRGKSNKYPFKRTRRRSFKKHEPSHNPDDYCQDKIDGFLYEKTDDYFYDKGFQYNQSENFFPGNSSGYCSDKGDPFNCDNDNMVGNVTKFNQFNAWIPNEMEGPMQRFPKHGKSVFDRLSTKDPKSELGGRAYRGKQPFPGDASSWLEDGSIPFSNSKKKKLKAEVKDISYEELLEQTAKQLKEPLEEEEEKKCSSFDTIDEYVQMFVEQGCSEYNIIKKTLGVSLDTRFDTMSKTRRKKIRKKIQSQLQALKQAPTINNNGNEPTNLFPKIPMPPPSSSSESAAFNLDSIPICSSLKSMSDSIEFLQNIWLKRRPEEEGLHNSLSSSEAQEDSDDDSNSTNNVEMQEDTNITDPEVRRAVHKVRANMLSAAEKNGIGIPHQKIPLSLLLAEEKDSLYSSEGCFLILMRKIPTKSVERLVTLREVLDHINCEVQLAQKNNDAPKFQTLQATKINLHERRKCVLENFTGLLNRKRLRLIEKACRKYQCCLDYMNANPDVIKDIDKEFVVKSLKAIQGHRSTVKNILENKDCNALPPPPLVPNSQLSMGMTSSEPFRNEPLMNGLELQTALRFLVSNCHENFNL